MDASNAQTPSAGLVQNLNLDFNALRVQAIMETIQRMAPDGSPLAVLAQQGAEAANLVVAEKLASVPQRKPYVSNNDRARHDWSEAASSASPNHHLAKHDARRRITQNRATWEYGHDQNDLCNVIEYQRHLRDRAPSPPLQSIAEDIAPVGRTGFWALVGPLKQVRWSDKFKADNIDRYDGSNNFEEFIQVYQIIFEASGGDDRVNANFLPMALTGVARSWLINLSEWSITFWDQLWTCSLATSRAHTSIHLQ
jgi:hypothetical protein